MSSYRGSCECQQNKTCVNPNESCNCDSGNSENKWYSDEGVYRDSQHLGITSMYFLQQKNLVEEARGRITLGPLKCVETSKSCLRDLLHITKSEKAIFKPPLRLCNKVCFESKKKLI